MIVTICSEILSGPSLTLYQLAISISELLVISMRTAGRFARKYHGCPRRGSTNEIRRERVARGGNRERGETKRRENATSFRPSAAGPRELFRPFPPPFIPFLFDVGSSGVFGIN